jgi:hypothetical protein
MSDASYTKEITSTNNLQSEKCGEMPGKGGKLE